MEVFQSNPRSYGKTSAMLDVIMINGKFPVLIMTTSGNIKNIMKYGKHLDLEMKKLPRMKEQPEKIEYIKVIGRKTL